MLMRPGRLRVNWLLCPSAQQLRQPWLIAAVCSNGSTKLCFCGIAVSSCPTPFIQECALVLPACVPPPQEFTIAPLSWNLSRCCFQQIPLQFLV